MQSNTLKVLLAGVIAIGGLSSTVTNNALALTITKTSHFGGLVVGKLKRSNPVDVTFSDGSQVSVDGNATENLTVALPILQAGNVDVSNLTATVSSIVTASAPGNAAADQISQLGFNISPGGMVFASIRGTGGTTVGALLISPIQAVIAASALASGKKVSFTTNTVELPIYYNGVFVSTVSPGAIIERIDLLN